MKTFEISGRLIGEECEPFIIAEAGINHNGNIELAKEMILFAKDAGVDAVKFQTFRAEEFIQDDTTTYTYKSQGEIITESMLEMFKRYEFSEHEWIELKNFCDEQNIIFLSTPQNYSDLQLLLKIGISAIKIGSDDFVNIPLVRKYADTGLPIMLSCGMANEEEINRTLEEVRNNPTVLFLCTSQYPTPPIDVNILRLNTMKQNYPDAILGLSDHTQGSEAAIMAVALGAKVFEKHFTLDHNLPGPDHWFSEDVEGLSRWVRSIRKANMMRGYADLKPTTAELEMRTIAHRSITVLKEIHSGDFFSESNIGMRRPGNGLPASMFDAIIGKKSVNNLLPGQQLHMEDIDNDEG